jgi:hypothetical protein
MRTSLKYILLVLLCSGTSFFSFSQVNDGVRRLYAFSKKQDPGNIRVDENHKPVKPLPQVAYSIVIETNGQEVHWEKAWRNGVFYSIHMTYVANPPFNPGMDAATGKPIHISPATGAKLWSLELEMIDKPEKVPANLRKDQILLVGFLGKRRFTRIVNRVIPLMNYPGY